MEPQDLDDSGPTDDEEKCRFNVEQGTFSFPAYLQRYHKVLQVLESKKWREAINKVADFGCSKWNFLRFLKKQPYIREVIGLDIDEDELHANNYIARPLMIDHLVSSRKCPLDIILMKGSIAEPDDRFQDLDALVGIEVIEHLHPQEMEKLPDNVFGYLKPNLVVFTTPNQDFNELFPNFEGPFRHYDHKFEFTRSEFEDWSNSILARFPDYEVELSGIGPGPVGTEEKFGHCTQMAVFVKKGFKSLAQDGKFMSMNLKEKYKNYKVLSDYANSSLTQSYRMETSFHIGHKEDERTDDEILRDEVSNSVQQLATKEYFESEEYDEIIKIKLEDALCLCSCEEIIERLTISEIRNILIGMKIEVEEDAELGLYVPFCTSKLYSDSSESDEESDTLDRVMENTNLPLEEEIWD